MNEYEQRLCENQAEFFALSFKQTSCGSSYFVARFMNSQIAKECDRIADSYNDFSPSRLMSCMVQSFPSIKSRGGEKYPEPILRWVGYVYRAWNIITGKKSSEIYKACKAEQMFALYHTFHTFSVEYCVERLEELVAEKEPPRRSDYEIYSELRRKRI